MQSEESEEDLDAGVYERLRESACHIYEQYLNECVDAIEDEDLLRRLRGETLEQVNELWLEGVRKEVRQKLHEQLVGLERSPEYIRLLADLDLLPNTSSSEDSSVQDKEHLQIISVPHARHTRSASDACVTRAPTQLVSSAQVVSTPARVNSAPAQVISAPAQIISTSPRIVLTHTGSTQITSTQSHMTFSPTQLTTTPVQLNLNPTQLTLNTAQKVTTPAQINFTSAQIASSAHKTVVPANTTSIPVQITSVQPTGPSTLRVEIIEAGVVNDRGKTYGIYATAVKREWTNDGRTEEWHVYRRYSDYHELQVKIRSRWPDLGRLPFPAKKTFHNMERGVLERRMRMLNAYMRAVTEPTILNSHVGLRDCLLHFLHPTQYDRTTYGHSHIAHALRHGISAIKSVPERVLRSASPSPGVSPDPAEDNIPLRVVLLLMDEVFDLRSRNQWLRRRIVTLLRQLIHTMFGDIVNRRILDYVSLATSPANVARYLHVFK